MKCDFKTVDELLNLNVPIWQASLMREASLKNLSENEILDKMEKNLEIMEASVKKGLKGVKSLTGLTGLDAPKIFKYASSSQALSGPLALNAVSFAVASNEYNSSMGVICAAPTAGSCGVVPGVLFAIKLRDNCTKEQMIRFLLTTGAFGLIIANNAFISGAAGGCQAEIGSASAMAAAAAVEIMGGTKEQSADACAIALKNLLGLICDPVAGLVEIPCIKRNAIGASNALLAADMALSGVKSKIPCDEVIKAMKSVGKTMPSCFKETALGGLAITDTAKKFGKEILKK